MQSITVFRTAATAYQTMVSSAMMVRRMEQANHVAHLTANTLGIAVYVVQVFAAVAPAMPLQIATPLIARPSTTVGIMLWIQAKIAIMEVM